MPRDTRPFIFLHNAMPNHHKVEPLSDAAFRLLVKIWCWCDEQSTDGHVKEAIWRNRGTPKTRRELIDAGLMEDDLMGGVIVHDYDDHQRTAEEKSTYLEERAQDGVRGAHRRWHIGRGISDPNCKLCVG